MSDVDKVLNKGVSEVKKTKAWLPKLVGGFAGFTTSKLLNIFANILDKVITKLPKFIADIFNDIGIKDVALLIVSLIVGGIGLSLTMSSWIGQAVKGYLVGTSVGGLMTALDIAL
tara:strand:+ start:5164 stop:5508 length:345 start_codon:yes stop_codon:yes gene_type:complete